MQVTCLAIAGASWRENLEAPTEGAAGGTALISPGGPDLPKQNATCFVGLGMDQWRCNVEVVINEVGRARHCCRNLNRRGFATLESDIQVLLIIYVTMISRIYLLQH